MLLRLALLVCPREFRDHYGGEIRADAAEGRTVRAAADAVMAGLGMRFENLARDVRLAARALLKARLYSVTVIATIALAVGANVAVASVVKGLLLDPLPYVHPGELYAIGETPNDSSLSYPEAVDIARDSTTIASIALNNSWPVTISGFGRPTTVAARMVNDAYFSTLGVSAELGRLLARRDLGKRNVVVSHAFWQRYFHGNTSVIGATLQLNGADYRVTGVAPRGFLDTSLTTNDLWLALDPADPNVNSRGNYFYTAVARLRPGVSRVAAQADLTRVLRNQYRRYPQNHGVFHGAGFSSLLDTFVGPVRGLLWLLYGAVALVLLVACANIAGLQLVRAQSREQDISIRSAVGATRARVAAHLAAETLLLAIAGGMAGIVLAYVGLTAFGAYGSQMLPRWQSIGIDAPMFAYAAALIALIVVLGGLLPAFWQRSNRQFGKSRALLLVAELALAIAVVTSAGLLARSYVTLTHVPLNFSPDSVYDVQFNGLPSSYYKNLSLPIRFERTILEQLRRIPGVKSAAAAWMVPFNDAGNNGTGLLLPGRPDPHASTSLNSVSPGYFATLGTPLLYGRDFNNGDRLHTLPVAIVNETFALRFFGTPKVVGHLIQPANCMACAASSPSDYPKLTIVGVVGDARNTYDEPAVPMYYFVSAQNENFAHFLIKTDGHTQGLANAVSAAFARVDPTLAPPQVVPYSELLTENALGARATTVLFGVMAFIALLLALAGTYGVTAYVVERRTHEFGIRKAVGALDGAIFIGVVKQALLYACAGTIVGFILTALFAKALQPLLFETSPFDAATFFYVAALVILTTIAAASVPALRAIRIQPASALRYE